MSGITVQENLKFRDRIEGRIREAFPEALTQWEGRPPTQILKVLINEESDEKLIRILVVSEDNVTTRRVKGEAVFRIRSVYREELLKANEAIIVAYDPATRGGEFWPESRGNDRKGSYVRFASTEDVESANLGKERYKEITSTLTEINFRAFVNGEAMRDFDDYSTKRYVWKR